MIRQRLVAGLVTVTALATLAACGSDTKSSSTTKSTTTEAVADTASSATVGTGASTGDSTSDVSVPDVSVPELTGECVALQKDLPDMSDATSFSTDDVDKAFATLEDRVPDDLKDDIVTIKTTLQPFYDAVAKAGGDATKAMQDPEVVKQAQTAFTDPKFTEASTALDDWFKQGCPS